MRHIPQRTCIVCRQTFDKRRLTRVVRTPDAGVIVDRSGKRNGRGAYLCDQSTCWDRMVTVRQILNQALRTTVGDAELAAIDAQRPNMAEVGESKP